MLYWIVAFGISHHDAKFMQSNHTEPEPTDENLDERQRNIVRFHLDHHSRCVAMPSLFLFLQLQLALRAKRKMLGNMRFLGELFKVGILKVLFATDF